MSIERPGARVRLSFCVLPLLTLAASCSSAEVSTPSTISSGDSGAADSSGATTAGASTSTTGPAAPTTTTTGGITVTPVTPTEPTEPTTPDEIRNSACAGWSAEPEGLPAVLELVVDVSGSMDDDAPGGNGASKWNVTHDALVQGIAQLPATTAAGVLFYPNRDTDGTDTNPQDVAACVNTGALIPVDILGDAASAQRMVIGNALDNAGPDGLTPTHDAYLYALQNGLLTTALPGQKFMLLITDGAPTLAQNCTRGANQGGGQMGGGGGGVTQVDPQPIVDAIASAYAQGVSTFVIGSPGSEEGMNGEDMRPWLSRAAMVGGTAAAGCNEAGPNFCHFDMTQEPDFGAALSEALGEIAGQIVSCDYGLPTPPAGQTLDLNLINAIYTSAGVDQVLPRVPDGQPCTSGWQVVGDQITLCPDTCSLIQNDPGASFELLFGCEPLIDIPE